MTESYSGRGTGEGDGKTGDGFGGVERGAEGFEKGFREEGIEIEVVEKFLLDNSDLNLDEKEKTEFSDKISRLKIGEKGILGEIAEKNNELNKMAGSLVEIFDVSKTDKVKELNEIEAKMLSLRRKSEIVEIKAINTLLYLIRKAKGLAEENEKKAAEVAEGEVQMKQEAAAKIAGLAQWRRDEMQKKGNGEEETVQKTDEDEVGDKKVDESVKNEAENGKEATNKKEDMKIGEEGRKRLIELLQKRADSQPETTREILEKQADVFTDLEIIDGKFWLFSFRYGDKAMALVNSDEEPKVFRPRFFRISGSDHQFKAFAGYREGGKAVLKGDEESPNQHYVQSAKLDARIDMVLQNLPEADGDILAGIWMGRYIPAMAGKGEEGRNLEDFQFSEEQVELKNEEWKGAQELERFLFNLYQGFNSFIFSREAGKNQNYLEKVFEYEVFRRKADVIELKNLWGRIEERSKELKIGNLSQGDDEQKRYVRKLKEVGGLILKSLIEGKRAATIEESGFYPDFSLKPVRRYVKGDAEMKIRIEEFETTSPEGDCLRWAMAKDQKGRVYVDNIYDPRVGIDSYGTPKKKVNMGMLIYKPEDYVSQVWSIPEKYIKSLDGESLEDKWYLHSGDYVDISEFLGLMKPVQMYKEALKKRGER